MRPAPLALLTAVGLATLTAVTTFAGSAAAIPPHPRWESSAPFGAWNNGGYIVYNNEWNQPTGPQTIWADSYHKWGVQSRQAAGNTAVETYPCVQWNFSNLRVTSFHQMSNRFVESMPTRRGVDAEAADDIWLNHAKIELMIWVDNHGQSPGGSLVGHATIFGQHFAVWHGGTYFAFVLNHNETSGVTHILATIDWLITHHYVAASVTIAQVNFGWEIASTDGKALNFEVSKYRLYAQR